MKLGLKGFTLIELMITVTIVSILAAIAIPSYLSYTRAAYYSEMVAAVGPFKNGVVECFDDTGQLAGCDSGTNHIPVGITSAMGAVASLTVTDGVVTVTPVAAHGILSTDTYILTPTVTNGTTLVWSASGGGFAKGYAQ